jgi:anti-sigma factor RsiW
MASQEQNEAVAGLLRRGLARDASAGNCPEPDLLAAYFEHSLDKNETSQVDQHLSTCSRCRQQMAAMVRADTAEPHGKVLWLLDWRLLTATAVMMLIATESSQKAAMPGGPCCSVDGR